jgi:hypothetical protein
VPIVAGNNEPVEALCATPLVVGIGEHVRLDVHDLDATSAAWEALLVTGCTDGGTL